MPYLLQHLLADSAARAPRQVAITDAEQSLTYEQLDRLSNRLARALRARGVQRGDRVGILAVKSAASVVAVYAVLKAGACYVPLDPGSPDERLALIVADSDLAVLVADEMSAPRAAELAGSVPGLGGVIVVGPQRSPGEPDAALPLSGAIDADIAYVLYTSGSTGMPKGVMISHRASLTFVRWAARCVMLRGDDRVCSPAPLHFDLSVFDIFATCMAAARMVVVPAGTSMFPVRLAQWLEQQQVSVWYSVPSLLTMLATHGNLQGVDLSRLRTVIFAGEVFPAKHLALLMAQLPRARHLNWYGPTETNVCTWYEVPGNAAAPADPLPIGRACTNMDVFAVSGDGRRVSRAGEQGELFVRGSGLMSGYWRQPERSREVLGSNPLQEAYDEPVYRTGDMVTLDAHGDYVFLGRRDGMVKTRGYRVELGEVETVLYGHPGIREAAVVPVPDELLGNRLRAVVCSEPGESPGRDELLDHCRRQLPAYMVPDAVEFAEALPRTSTGKVDRVRLCERGPGGGAA